VANLHDNDPDGQIRRYDDPVPDDAPSPGDSELINAVDGHITKWIGAVDVVYHEIVSPYVHVDIHHIPPSEDHPFHVLVTSGMSEMPMTTPEGAEEYRYAELLICLPPEWPLTEAAFEDERHYWPVRWLKMLARFPHQYGTWLGWGHTMPNGDPPLPFTEGTKLCGMLILPSISLPEEAATLELPDGRTVHFWALYPLYDEEMAIKLRKGAQALLPLFEKHNVSDVVDPTRVNVGTRRWWRI
jgi:hypothetical protein